MNTAPLEEYIKGVEAFKQGNKEEALALISSSLGADKPTEIMKSSLEELTHVNIAALRIILHRSKEND